MIDLVVGFLAGAFLFGLGKDVYLIWQFRERWAVIRRDIVALNEQCSILHRQLEAYVEEQGLRKAQMLTDPEIANIERRNQMRKLLRDITVEN